MTDKQRPTAMALTTLTVATLALFSGCTAQRGTGPGFVPTCDAQAPHHLQQTLDTKGDAEATANLMVDRGWSNVHADGKSVSGDCQKSLQGGYS